MGCLYADSVFRVWHICPQYLRRTRGKIRIANGRRFGLFEYRSGKMARGIFIPGAESAKLQPAKPAHSLPSLWVEIFLAKKTRQGMSLIPVPDC